MADTRMPPWLRAVLPWIITAALLALVFLKVDFRKTVANFRDANLWVFLPAAILFNFYIFFINSLVYTKVLNWFCGPVKYSSVLAIRGASYLLTSLNTGAGQGGMLLWMSKKERLPFWEVISAALMVPVADLSFLAVALTIPVALNSFIGGVLPDINIRILLLVIGIFWGLLLAHFLFWNVGGDKIARRFKQKAWFKAYRNAGVRQYVILLGIRCLQHIPGVLAFYVGLRAFGGIVPFGTFVIRFPAALVIQSLPVTMFQLGTAQGGWLLMFGNLVDQSRLVAFTLSWSFVYSLVRIAIGAFFFRGEMRAFFRGAQGEPNAQSTIAPQEKTDD